LPNPCLNLRIFTGTYEGLKLSKEKRKSEEADSELIEVFLAGDDHAFDALVLKYQLRIVNLY
jgi:hypothetical protein